MRFSFWGNMLLIVLLLLAASRAVWCWNLRQQPEWLLDSGREALQENDLNGVAGAMAQLKHLGHENAARLLSGELKLHEARTLLKRSQTVPSPQIAFYLRAKATTSLQLALVELTAVKDEGPLSLAAAESAGECLFRLGQHPLAAEAFTMVLRQQSNNKEAARWLAAIYIDLNEPANAIKYLREWARLDPANGRPYRWIGFFAREFYGKENHQAVLDAYRAALARQLEPRLKADVVRELARALIEEGGHYAKALAILDQCPSTYRDETEILLLRADALRGQGQFTEAAKLLEQTLKRKPNNPTALRLRASLFIAADKPKQALPLLEKALTSDPHDVTTRSQLLSVLNLLGDKSRARQEQKLIELSKSYIKKVSTMLALARDNPWDDQTRYRLGLLFLEMRRPDDARTWFRAALTSNPRNAQAREALDCLARGDEVNDSITKQ